MFSNQKNKWNLGVKSNFENFEFWVVPISKSALVMTTVHQFQKLRLFFCMVFNQEFEFCSQNFITSLLRNSIFLHSEARLSSIMQNWKKLLSFHDCLPKEEINFEFLLLNLHTLNYHILHYSRISYGVSDKNLHGSFVTFICYGLILVYP